MIPKQCSRLPLHSVSPSRNCKQGHKWLLNKVSMPFLLPENLSQIYYVTTSPLFPKQNYQLCTELLRNGGSLLICRLRNKLVNHGFEFIVGRRAQPTFSWSGYVVLRDGDRSHHRGNGTRSLQVCKSHRWLSNRSQALANIPNMTGHH